MPAARCRYSLSEVLVLTTAVAVIAAEGRLLGFPLVGCAAMLLAGPAWFVVRRMLDWAPRAAALAVTLGFVALVVWLLPAVQ